MGKKTAKKEVAYKDTFKFKLFPEYEYTVPQKKRFRLFQGRVEHWKAAVNYADNFKDPDKINLLYMIGYNSAMRNYVQKTSSNLVILCAKFAPEDLALYDRYHELMKKIENGAGLYDKESDRPMQRYLNDLTRFVDNVEAAREGGLGDKAYEIATDYRDEMELFKQYAELKAQSAKYYKRYTIIDKLHPEKTISHDNLDWIIKRYFPDGREQRGISVKAYKGIKTVDNALQAGLAKENAAKLFGVENDTAELFKHEIKRCQMNINVAIRACGNVALDKIFEQMQSPPYGWSTNDAHSAYCFGYAVTDYLDNGWFHDSVTTWPFKDAAYSALLTICKGIIGGVNRLKSWRLYTEDGWRMVNRLVCMFGVPETLPFDTMLMLCRQSISEHTRYPIALLDDELFYLLGFNTKAGDEYDPMDSNVVRKFLKHFTWELCEEIRDKYATINDDVPKMVLERYPDFDLSYLINRCTSQASGWGWMAETFWETVDREYLRQELHADWFMRQEGDCYLVFYNNRGTDSPDVWVTKSVAKKAANGEEYDLREVAEALAKESRGKSPCECCANDADMWLPKYCEFSGSCDSVNLVDCWEQYLKYNDKAPRQGKCL